jgi:hypothetical protein
MKKGKGYEDWLEYKILESKFSKRGMCKPGRRWSQWWLKKSLNQD